MLSTHPASNQSSFMCPPVPFPLFPLKPLLSTSHLLPCIFARTRLHTLKHTPSKLHRPSQDGMPLKRFAGICIAMLGILWYTQLLVMQQPSSSAPVIKALPGTPGSSSGRGDKEKEKDPL